MMAKVLHRKRGKKGVILGIFLLCLMVFAALPFASTGVAATSPDTTVVWISDQDANTILQTLPLTKDGSLQSPLVVYDPGAENEIINFISQLNPAPTQIRIVETYANTIPDSFITNIHTATGIDTVRLAPIDDYAYDSWISKSGGPQNVVVSDVVSFMPYASIYAYRTNSAFVNSYAKAQDLVQNDTDVKSVIYFGNNVDLKTNLANLAAASGKTFQEINTLDDAMVMLTPDHLAGTANIVTMIHQNDDVSLAPNIQYWKIAPIYAALRNTMLITVSGSSAEAVDNSVDNRLDNIIDPHNNEHDPGYLVVVGHWTVFPYRFKDDRFSYQLSADARYADRDNDGDYVPDIPFGRFTAYNIANAVLLMNKGVFFDNGMMTRATRAVFSTDWTVEHDQATVSALESMYGPENVYAKGDTSFSNSLMNNPSRTEVLNEAKSAEVIILTGHGNPNYLSATNPAVNGQSIKGSRFYPPSLWWFSGCDTGSYYSYSNSLVAGAIASNAINIVAGVDTIGTHSSALDWYADALVAGNDIGTVLQQGYKACEASYGVGAVLGEVNKLPQMYLIGDPLVNYPSAGYTIVNHSPVIPSSPNGPSAGVIGMTCTYSTSATDPDNDQLTYVFDWGDGSTSTTGLVNSGEVAIATHTWSGEGEYSVKVQAVDSEGASSDWSPASMVNIAIPDTPWKGNENGSLFTDRGWDYTLGYEFTPEVSGIVTELGGLFDGTKVVSLWDMQGNLLASVTLTSANDWSYVPLSEPIEVVAGQSYKVAVYVAGSGASYTRYIENLPQTYGDITIEASCYESGNNYPDIETTTFMFGQVDIGFVPNCH